MAPVPDIAEVMADVEQLLDESIEARGYLIKPEAPLDLSKIDFDKLRQVEFKDRGERSLRFKFPEVEGLPTDLVFGHQVFALQKGRSVAPHGHNNMATAFLILQGEFQGRHYDRLEDEAEHAGFEQPP